MQPSEEKGNAHIHHEKHIEDNIDSSSEASSDFPEGGRTANLVLLGSFLSLLGGLGYMNSIGIYQAWISTHQLHDVHKAKVGWIFGVYNAMSFFCGVQIGPIFDAQGPRWLMIAGTLLFILSFVLQSFCQAYWQFLVVIGFLARLASSFIFIVPVSCLSHYFNRRRGTATGLAVSGGSIGGIIFPLAFEHLAVRIGYQWAVQAVGLITVVLLVAGCILLRPRLPPTPMNISTVLPTMTILNSPAIILTAASVFFMEWAFFVGLDYLSSYSLAYGISRGLSYDMTVFLNVGSFFGRWIPGIVADRFGRFNTMIGANVLCVIALLAIWLPAGGKVAVVVVFAVAFGFASGSTIGLAPVCIGELCKVENYGRTYAVIYTIASIAYVSSGYF